jgi:hypothetical protein
MPNCRQIWPDGSVRSQQVLSTTLLPALELLRSGEPWVEIRPQANAEA